MAILSHAQQVNAPVECPIGGKPYLVSRLTNWQIGQLDAHLHGAFPDPLKEARQLLKEDAADKVFTAEERALILRDAQRKREKQYRPDGIQVGGWPVEFGSIQGGKYYFGGAGIGHYLWVILTRNHPALTRKEAEDLAREMSQEEFVAFQEAVANRLPGDDDEAPGADEDPLRDDLPEGYCDPN